MTDAVVGFLVWYGVTCFQLLAAAFLSTLRAFVNAGLFTLMVGVPVWIISLTAAALQKALGWAGRTWG